VNHSGTENKKNGASVESGKRHTDGFAVLKMMREITGEAPRMWGESIIGLGSYHYK